MAKNKSPSVSIPTYTAPTPTTFETPWGTASLEDNVLTFAQSPQDAATDVQVKQIRSDLLKSLGVQDTQIKGMQDNLLATLGTTYDTSKWTDLLMKEALRTSGPQLENSLIGRGLGGSTVYKDALTDLYSKLGTQAALSGADYGNAQQTALLNKLSTLQNLQTSQSNIPLAQLTALQNILGQNATSGQNLLQLMSGYNANQQQLSQQQYQALLPYLAQVKASQNYSGLGGLLGAGLMGGLSLLVPGAGIGLAGLTGAQMTGLGALAGSSIGGLF